LLGEDKYLRYHEFDRVSSLRGRPRGSDPLAPDPRAPRSTAPISAAHPASTAPPAPAAPTSTGRTSGLNPSIRRQRSQWEGTNLEQEDTRDEVVTQAQRTVNGLTPARSRRPRRSGWAWQSGWAREQRPGSRTGAAASTASTTRASTASPISTAQASFGARTSTPTTCRARGGITKASTRGTGTRRSTRALAAAFAAQESSDLNDA
jgi:hypothetical protein